MPLDCGAGTQRGSVPVAALTTRYANQIESYIASSRPLKLLTLTGCKTCRPVPPSISINQHGGRGLWDGSRRILTSLRPIRGEMAASSARVPQRECIATDGGRREPDRSPTPALSLARCQASPPSFMAARSGVDRPGFPDGKAPERPLPRKAALPAYEPGFTSKTEGRQGSVLPSGERVPCVGPLSQQPPRVRSMRDEAVYHPGTGRARPRWLPASGAGAGFLVVRVVLT
ncbi:unnamed protein product [Arctogadus glacialis]